MRRGDAPRMMKVCQRHVATGATRGSPRRSNGHGASLQVREFVERPAAQVYEGRSFFVLLVLVGLIVTWFSNKNPNLGLSSRVSTSQHLARLGELFFYTMAGIQISLAILVAPAATAGSICIDRARGTLTHMLMTDLSNAEIVLGKLGAGFGALDRHHHQWSPGCSPDGLTRRDRIRFDRGRFRHFAFADCTGLHYGNCNVGLGNQDKQCTDRGLHH